MRNDLPQVLQDSPASVPRQADAVADNANHDPSAPVAAEGPSPAARPASSRRNQWLAVGIAALAVVALGFPMESVVVAPGSVIPSDRVKSIQHLEGGIVRAVMVREGQAVREGMPLVEIDLGGNSLNLEELSARHAAQQATRVRLQAESRGLPLMASQFESGTAESVIQGEMGAYQARALEQRGVMAGAQAALEQARSRQMEQHAQITGLQERQALMQTELQISEQLLREKLIGQLEVLEKRRQSESVRAELAVARQALISANAAIGEAQAKMAEAEGRFRRRASDELATVERQLSSLSEDLSRARTQRSRTVVTAPSDGIIKGLRSASPGWVVKPGEAILEVVPVEEEILIEARLSPNDRGFVHSGQKARVKVTAYDFLRYGTVDGTVMLVAADADRDTSLPTAPPYYRLLVNTAQAHVGRPENRITAGMEAEVDLVVGTDPFIWYLLRPVLKTQREAFREP